MSKPMYQLTHNGKPVGKPHPHRITCYIEALEEANKRVCDERDFYMSQCHAYEARLAGKVYD